MNSSLKVASISGLILNAILFVGKFTIGILSNSIAVISDSFNSFTDIFSSTAIYISVKISGTKADEKHQFGHRRAEPIAGLIVAIFSGIVGFEVLKESVLKFFEPHEHSIGTLSIVVLSVNIVVKIFMSVYFKRIGTKHNSPAILASSIDSRNDVLSVSVALIGVVGAYFGYPKFDETAGTIIALIILYSGYRIGKENIDYLMGISAKHEVVKSITTQVQSVEGVHGIKEIRTHYVGHFIQTEISILVEHNLPSKMASDIARNVKSKVEELELIDNASVIIETV